VRRKIMTSVTMKTTVSWNLMPYGLVEVYLCFSASYYCHPHGTWWMIMQAAKRSGSWAYC